MKEQALKIEKACKEYTDTICRLLGQEREGNNEAKKNIKKFKEERKKAKFERKEEIDWLIKHERKKIKDLSFKKRKEIMNDIEEKHGVTISKLIQL